MNHKSPVRIAIVAPSGPYQLSKLDIGLDILRSWGWNIVYIPNQEKVSPYPFLHASDNDRLWEIKHVIKDIKPDVIWCARGGYGITRLLPTLHSWMQTQTFPLLVGFSDVTAWLSLSWQHQHHAVHGPLITTLANCTIQEQARIRHTILKLLYPDTLDDLDLFNLLPPLKRLSTMAPTSELQGSLFAANLCVLTSLIGTPWMPHLHNAIAILEDVGEKPYRIDRMLVQCKQSGVFNPCHALIVGDFHQCDDVLQQENTSHTIIEEMFLEHFPTHALYKTASVGHGANNWPIPIGKHATIHHEESLAYLRVLENFQT